MYLEKLREAVVDIFQEMLENGDIEPIKNGDFWRNSMGSDAILYSNKDDLGSLYISHTDNFGAEETNLPAGTEDVYIGLEDCSEDIIKTFGFPKESDIKALIKEVYTKFYNDQNKSKAESLIERLNKLSKEI